MSRWYGVLVTILVVLLNEVSSATEYCTGYGHYCDLEYEYCCGYTCCRYNTPGYGYSVWNLWYFWFVVIFVMMACCGGCGYYRRRQHLLQQSRMSPGGAIVYAGALPGDHLSSQTPQHGTSQTQLPEAAAPPPYSEVTTKPDVYPLAPGSFQYGPAYPPPYPVYGASPYPPPYTPSLDDTTRPADAPGDNTPAVPGAVNSAAAATPSNPNMDSSTVAMPISVTPGNPSTTPAVAMPTVSPGNREEHRH
ncbi:WW domain binding protein VOPP1-like isoform X2 [Branchiostoma lanceolatum]|uniref:WW domain binding protein VOPP1-like isoform X2 n=1 Tax=Branchiostoma lanceolatum TaxID=7740 RepID=UPI003454BCA3